MRFDPIDPADVSRTRRWLTRTMPAVSRAGRAVWQHSRVRSSTWFDQSRLWRGLWNVNRLVGCLPRRTTTEIDVEFGQQIAMRLDLSRLTDVLCYMYGPGEGEIGYVARSLCDRDAVVADVGTNVGTAALFFAACVPDGTVHAFEPSAAMRRALATNLELCGFSNLIVHPYGLADQPKRGALQLAHPGNPGSAFFTESDDADDIELRVMDDIMADYDRLDLIKIDVEGLELSVLRGGARTIQAHRPTLLVEVNSTALERFGTPLSELYDLLESWGYQAMYVHRGRFRPLDDPELRARKLYNLIAIHPDGRHGAAASPATAGRRIIQG